MLLPEVSGVVPGYACALRDLGQANSGRRARAFGILAVREKMVTNRKNRVP
jgi:hypothetical protein